MPYVKFIPDQQTKTQAKRIERQIVKARMKASEGLKEFIDKFQVTHFKNVVLFHNKS